MNERLAAAESLQGNLNRWKVSKEIFSTKSFWKVVQFRIS